MRIFLRRIRRLCIPCWLVAGGFAGFNLAGCGDSSPPQPAANTSNAASEFQSPSFVDLTQPSGVRSTYHNGEESRNRSIVESLGGGVGICDYDRDGALDLYFPGGGAIEQGQPLTGLPGSLWKNLGQFKFANVTTQARVDEPGRFTHGIAIADYDNDGFPDLLVTGFGGLEFYRNLGDGTFRAMAAECGLTDELWSTSAAWADFNGDGQSDLYLCHYVDWSWQNHPYCPASIEGERETCSPLDFHALPDLVYWNNGDGTFQADPQCVAVPEPGKGLGVIAADVNDDGRIDVYVANDTTANLLYLNQGQGRFVEEGVIRGVAYDQRGLPNGSMGLAVFDYNHDRRADLWVTNFEEETFGLYHNEGEANFRCVTEGAGIAALGTLFVGFGTVAADFTNSGHEDLVVANGHVMLFPRIASLAQQPIYLRNTGREKFARVEFPEASYFSEKHRGRGVATADLDGDGQLDLVFTNVNEPAAILRQESKVSGNGLQLELIGRHSNRNAIGAKVTLQTSNGEQVRWIVGGGSYLSQNPYLVKFGMPPEAQPLSAEVTWPDGQVQKIRSIEGGTDLRIIEPDPES